MNPERYKIILIAAAPLAASSAVAVAWIIGLIALVVPHMLSIIFDRIRILEWSMGTEMISPGWGRPIWPGLLLECS
jgi:hypothetical protein